MVNTKYGDYQQLMDAWGAFICDPKRDTTALELLLESKLHATRTFTTHSNMDKKKEFVKKVVDYYLSELKGASSVSNPPSSPSKAPVPSSEESKQKSASSQSKASSSVSKHASSASVPSSEESKQKKPASSHSKTNQ